MSEVVRQAELALAEADPVMAAHIAAVGHCPLKPRSNGLPHFEQLARSIVYQQLAGKAAASIWARVRALVDGRFTAEAVVGLTYDELRSAGLSNNKALSVQDLALRVFDRRLSLDRIARLDDEAVIELLSEVRGIGRWTAEMFLIFQLHRMDVWPIGDLGVRNGYRLLYGMPEMPTPKELHVLGDKFAPHRSIAAWYCWRSVDVITP